MIKFIWMTLAGSLAFVNGRGVIGWTIAAYLTGPLALIVLVFLPKKLDKVEERMNFVRTKFEEYLVKQEFKDANTVDDLFKQLETK